MDNTNVNTAKQKALLSMLKYIDTVFSREKIWYSLAYGTLLGAVREKGFIPWDIDADIFVRYCDLKKIREVLQKDKESPYHLCVPGEEQNYSSCHERLTIPEMSHYDCHLDFYGLIGLPNEKPKKYVRRGYVSYVFFASKHKPFSETRHRFALAILKPFSSLFSDRFSNRYYERLAMKYPFEEAKYLSILGAAYGDYHLKSDMEKTCYLDFENIKLSCIASYDKFLKSVYGDYLVPRQKNYVSVSNE